MDFEIWNQKLGGCGRYQYIAFFLLTLTTYKFSGDVQSLTYALFVPKFHCVVEELFGQENITYSDDQCRYKPSSNSSWVACSRWSFDKDVLTESFISQFNLVCAKEYYRELMFSVYFAGNLASYPIIMFTDKIGRRSILILFVFLSTMVSIIQTIVYSLWQQFLLAFLSGFIRTVCTTLAFTILIELVPANKLDISATNFWIFYSISYMLSGLIAYLGRSWRYITWTGLIFTVFNFAYFIFIPETPRWLMLNKKREQSFKTMTFIAKINGCTFAKKNFDDWNPIHEPTGNFWNLFKYKIMIYRLLILNFAAWSFAFAYIGSSTDLTFASNNIFITTFVMGLIEFPACPLGGILANKCGRKPSICGLCIVGIICLVPLPFLEADLSISSWQPWVKVIVAMGAKFGFVSAWGIFDIIINETMPTTYRNSSMSLVYFAVGLGSIIAPMIHDAALHWYYAAPCLMYSAILVITVILVAFFIPETHSLPMPQTIEQAIRLVIHKEREWKEYMIKEAQSSGLDNVIHS